MVVATSLQLRWTQLLGVLEASAGKRHGAAAGATSGSVLERDGRMDPNTAQLHLGGIAKCAAGDVEAVQRCVIGVLKTLYVSLVMSPRHGDSGMEGRSNNC